jgi:hypothetical protein
MKYFLHDTSAFQDEKISKLFIEFGYEGIGLFFTLLEKIALQEKPINKDVLKKQLFVGKRLEKCLNFMEQIELISTKNGETFNENLLNYSKKYQIKKEKTREKVSEWRKNQNDTKNVTGYKEVTLPLRNHRKVKESKVKESKCIIYPTPEEINSYCTEKGYKVDAKKIFDYYSQNEWKDSRGKKVLNWQSKILAVWCKDENKISVNTKKTRRKHHGE